MYSYSIPVLYTAIHRTK